jgi:hypothetical protein
MSDRKPPGIGLRTWSNAGYPPNFFALYAWPHSGTTDVEGLDVSLAHAGGQPTRLQLPSLGAVKAAS